MTDMEEEEEFKYQVFVCNITWNLASQDRRRRHDECPTQMTLDIPEQILAQANKSKSQFNDIIEQFVYNILTRRFGCEVSHCQIWLPLEQHR